MPIFFLVALAFGIYGLTQGLCQLPAGYFSDVWGRKRILIIALILFLIGSLLVSYATNIYWIIAARLIQGMGAMASVVFALLADKTRNVRYITRARRLPIKNKINAIIRILFLPLDIKR